jgi:beta-lactam-binding protein with PASTA domain
MTTPDTGTDSTPAHGRRARTWRALAVVLGTIVILETAVLLRELARSPEPSPPAVGVPDLVGRQVEDAETIADAVGLVLQPTGRVSDQPISTVLEQDPQPGTTVDQGDPVRVVIAITAASASPSPSPAVTSRPSVPVATPQPPPGGIPVGDYRCMVLPEAEAHIRDDGFTVGRVSYSIEGGPVDDTWAVTLQDPQPHSSAARGAAIDILLSSPFGTCARQEGS